MPRVADHEARRRQIAEAVRALVAESGLESATVAQVAAKAGFSVGLVQYYFPSKDDLLLFTHSQVLEGIDARIADHIAAGRPQRRTILAVVLAALSELLPLDDERCFEHRVARAFAGRALDNPRLAAVSAETSARIRDRIAVAITNGKECGEVEPHADAPLWALRILAITKGLAQQVYDEPHTMVGDRTMDEAARETLRATLDGVFTGECRQYLQ